MTNNKEQGDKPKAGWEERFEEDIIYDVLGLGIVKTDKVLLKVRSLLTAQNAEWIKKCEKAIKENVERNIRAEGKRKDAEFKSVLEGLKYKRGKNEWATHEYTEWTNRINAKISGAIKKMK